LFPAGTGQAPLRVSDEVNEICNFRSQPYFLLDFFQGVIPGQAQTEGDPKRAAELLY
jgi:hypothetical protein